MSNLRNKIVTGSDKSLDLSKELSGFSLNELDENFVFFPGFIDVHVHFREPGFSYKETIKTGSLAAAHGGYVSVLTMPNLNPVPDSLVHLKEQLDIINEDSVVNVIPYGAITVGEKGEQLANMDEISPFIAAFSDDGRGVQEEEMMRKAMRKAKSLNKMIVAHCEVNSLLNGGYIHDGEYAIKHNHRGICSASEYEQVARDIRLSKEEGCAYHVCHISTKESVELIRKAKLEGFNVTCETAPHYLILDENDLKEDGYFKMNPPLRSKEDREALIEGIKDGTIDCIATDHAPHSEEEKSRGLEKSPFGIVGIEYAFPLLYTHLVKKGIITLEKLIDLLVINPSKRFNIPIQGFSIWNLDEEVTITKESMVSKGKATPFINKKVYGKNIGTYYGGKKVW